MRWRTSSNPSSSALEARGHGCFGTPQSGADRGRSFSPHQELVQGVPRRPAGAERRFPCGRRSRRDRDHRPLRDREIDARALHQSAGRPDRRRDPFPRPGSGPAHGPQPARRPPPHRHDLSGIQPGRAAVGDRERAVRPARLCGGVARMAAQVSGRGHRARLPAARCGGAGRACDPARRPAFRRPAPTGRHRARADAGTRPRARRRADLLARSENLGRDHGADRAPRRRARHPRHRQHAQRGACAPLRRPHRRHAQGRDRVRRFAAGADAGAPPADLRRRGVAGVIASPARRAAFPPNWRARIALIALALYVVYACGVLDVTWARFVADGAHLLARMIPPSVAQDKLELLYGGMIESLQIAIIATVVGVLISLPLGLAAARNLSPLPVAWTARTAIALFRAFHPVIVAILFVKAVGFGALAGMLALIVASLGFLSKLVAEAVEDMSMSQVEAVRATGAPFLSLVIMGVLPQVMSRCIGFAAYQLDSNLRNSALVGLVGGGGIGATMFTAFQRFEYDFVLTIALSVIAVVMAGEIVSGWMRRLFQ